LVFKVTYFLSGGCPDGQKQGCAYPGKAPFALVLAEASAEPFHLRLRVTSRAGPALANNGYSEFSIR
jgi:hypothetical protein